MGLITNLFLSLSPERQALMRKDAAVSEVLDHFELERREEAMRLAEIGERARSYGFRSRDPYRWAATDIPDLPLQCDENEAYVLIHAVWTLIRKREGHLNLCWEGVNECLEEAMSVIHEQLEDERIEDEADRREK